MGRRFTLRSVRPIGASGKPTARFGYPKWKRGPALLLVPSAPSLVCRSLLPFVPEDNFPQSLCTRSGVASVPCGLREEPRLSFRTAPGPLAVPLACPSGPPRPGHASMPTATRTSAALLGLAPSRRLLFPEGPNRAATGRLALPAPSNRLVYGNSTGLAEARFRFAKRLSAEIGTW